MISLTHKQVKNIGECFTLLIQDLEKRGLEFYTFGILEDKKNMPFEGRYKDTDGMDMCMRGELTPKPKK